MASAASAARFRASTPAMSSSSVCSAREACSSRSAICGAFELAQPAGRVADQHCGLVADERFEGLPIPAPAVGRLAVLVAGGSGAAQEATPQAGGVSVHAGQHPSGAGAGQLQVIGPHEPGTGNVDQTMAEEVRAQQHLTVAAFEGAQVQARRPPR